MPSPTYPNLEARGGSAFPLQRPPGKPDHNGMDLHDWFTGMALSGLLANSSLVNADNSGDPLYSDIAGIARHCAAEALRCKDQDYP